MPPKTTDMQHRAALGSGVHEDARTAMATLSTEQPVPMWDWEREMVVPEVLLSDGVQFPDSRQVPLLDNHNRGTTSDVKGSARNLHTGDRSVQGTLHFSKAAEREFQDYKDGHLTDVSVGYRVEKRRYVPAGQSQTIGGREFSGPVNVVTRWRLHEVSLTPIGADSQAKMRELAPAGGSCLNKLMFKLLTERGLVKADATEEQVKSVLVARGMPADTEDMPAWVDENDEKLKASNTEARSQESEFKGQTRQFRAEPKPIDVADEVRKALEAERKAKAAFREQVRDLCELAGCEDQAREFEALEDLAAVRKAIKDHRAKQQGSAPLMSGRVAITEDSADKFRTAFGGTFTSLMLQSRGLKDDKVKADASIGHVSPMRLARECVRLQGVNPDSLSNIDLVERAMFPNKRAGDQARAVGFHITGMFPAIMMDATNKTLLAAYNEAPSTYEAWVRRAASVSDFKMINRVRGGSLPDPVRMDDQVPPDEVSFSEEKVSYQLDTFRQRFSFSWKILINDDLDFLSRLPAERGAAFRRFINREAYRILTSNPTMPYDSVAYFSDVSGNRKSDNTTTGVISETSLGAARLLLASMRGVNKRDGSASDSYTPRTMTGILVPKAIETTARRYLNSEYLPESNLFQVVNQFNNLNLVSDIELDTASAAQWYALSDMMGFEITFLQGYETPVLSQEEDFDSKSIKYDALQPFAIAAIDHRAMVRSTGI